MNPNPAFIPILRKTLAKTVALLPSKLKSEVTAPLLASKIEPCWNSYPKKDLYHYRAVLMPATRPFSPKGFWNSHHCMYEVAVGFIKGRVGIQVQMLCGGHRKCCGEGAYVKQVDDIYRAAIARNARLQISGVKSKGYYSLLRVVSSSYPEEAAEEMAWIIEETYPKFITLPDAAR